MACDRDKENAYELQPLNVFPTFMGCDEKRIAFVSTRVLQNEIIFEVMKRESVSGGEKGWQG